MRIGSGLDRDQSRPWNVPFGWHFTPGRLRSRTSWIRMHEHNLNLISFCAWSSTAIRQSLIVYCRLSIRVAAPSTNASTLVRPSWRRDSLAVKASSGPWPERWAGGAHGRGWCRDGPRHSPSVNGSNPSLQSTLGTERPA